MKKKRLHLNGLIILKRAMLSLSVLLMLGSFANAQSVVGAKTDKGSEASGAFYNWADEDAMWGLQFDALKDMKLLSVKVYNGLAVGGDAGDDGTLYVGDRTFTVISAEDDTIGAATVNVVDGEQRLALNIVVPAGTGYRLISDNQVGLWRDKASTNETYPYAVGDIATVTGDIKWTGGSITTNQYHFFYDWEVEEVVPSITAELTTVIDSSKAVISGVTIGDAEGEYTQAKVDAANAAVAAAEASLASAATQTEADQATADLRVAMKLFFANGLTAIGSAVNANFRMYPNPVIDMLVLENISNVNNISILSITGKKMKSISNFNNTLNIDLSDFNSGVYVIRFNAKDDVSAKTFIKQ